MNIIQTETKLAAYREGPEDWAILTVIATLESAGRTLIIVANPWSRTPSYDTRLCAAFVTDFTGPDDDAWYLGATWERSNDIFDFYGATIDAIVAKATERPVLNAVTVLQEAYA